MRNPGNILTLKCTRRYVHVKILIYVYEILKFNPILRWKCGSVHKGVSLSSVYECLYRISKTVAYSASSAHFFTTSNAFTTSI